MHTYTENISANIPLSHRKSYLELGGPVHMETLLSPLVPFRLSIPYSDLCRRLFLSRDVLSTLSDLSAQSLKSKIISSLDPIPAPSSNRPLLQRGHRQLLQQPGLISLQKSR